MKELKDCPFCGGKPELLRIGNNHTKSRKVTIKCTSCRAQRTDAALRQDMDWLEDVAVSGWNNRAMVKES